MESGSEHIMLPSPATNIGLSAKDYTLHACCLVLLSAWPERSVDNTWAKSCLEQNKQEMKRLDSMLRRTSALLKMLDPVLFIFFQYPLRSLPFRHLSVFFAFRLAKFHWTWANPGICLPAPHLHLSEWREAFLIALPNGQLLQPLIRGSGAHQTGLPANGHSKNSGQWPRKGFETFLDRFLHSERKHLSSRSFALAPS